MDTHILIDTSIMLHDFFFRSPSLEKQAPNPVAQKVRNALHECLELLALQENTVLLVPQYCLYRLLGVLSDLQVSQLQIRQEMLYWLDNCQLIPTDAYLLERILEQPEPEEELEDSLLIQIAKDNNIGVIFSIKPRYQNLTQEARFVWPEKLLGQLK